MGYKPRAGGSSPTLAFGTYTPVFTDLSVNVSAFDVFDAQYLRVGNVVTVSGKTKLTFGTIALDTYETFIMDLPIASAFASEEQCGGTANGVDDGTPISIPANIIANVFSAQAQFQLVIPLIESGQKVTFSFVFQYLIV